MNRIFALLLAVALAGCASQANRDMLASDEMSCNAGDQAACAQIPVQQKINNDEASANALTAVGIAILLPLAIVAEAAAENHDQPQYQPVCWSLRYRRYVPC